MAKGSLSQEQRARLSWVKAPGRKVSLTRFPDFFFVGPQRNGSTWLHRNLWEHPNIFLSEPKETFFFSALKNPGNSKFQSDRLDWYLALFRDPPWRAAIRQARCL